MICITKDTIRYNIKVSLFDIVSERFEVLQDEIRERIFFHANATMNDPEYVSFFTPSDVMKVNADLDALLAYVNEVEKDGMANLAAKDSDCVKMFNWMSPQYHLL